MRDVNPNFAFGPTYQNNCTRCVVAQEMRVRGYNVEAAPAMGDYANRVLRRTFTKESMDAAGVAPNMIAPKGGRLSAVGADAPDGARFWVSAAWKKGGGGHIWSAERRNGKTVFFEPQTGKELGTKGYTGQVKNVRYVRVDQLDLWDKALELVVW